MERLKEHILLSKEYNKNRNIFFYKDEEFPLGNNIIDGVEKLGKLNLNEDEIKKISIFTVNLIKDILIENNQYINFDNNLKESIYYLYNYYFTKINLLEDMNLIKELTKDYQKKLINIFESIQEIKILDNNKENIEKIPCSQYSAKHQISILNLDLFRLENPILDIGAGYDANLVEYFRKKSFNAYGIDRKISIKRDYLLEKSWFEFSFMKNTWGIIIAHMSFTNHFKREHLKRESEYIKYAEKYMEILNSLKKGGRFFYTPSLEFIENLLPEEQYEVINYNIKSNYLNEKSTNENIKSTMILKK